MRRRRAVVKDMPQVSVATRALNFVPLHPVRAVPLRFDVLFRDGLPETGPAGAGFELWFWNRREPYRSRCNGTGRRRGCWRTCRCRGIRCRLGALPGIALATIASSIRLGLFDFFHFHYAVANAGCIELDNFDQLLLAELAADSLPMAAAAGTANPTDFQKASSIHHYLPRFAHLREIPRAGWSASAGRYRRHRAGVDCAARNPDDSLRPDRTPAVGRPW